MKIQKKLKPTAEPSKFLPQTKKSDDCTFILNESSRIIENNHHDNSISNNTNQVGSISPRYDEHSDNFEIQKMHEMHGKIDNISPIPISKQKVGMIVIAGHTVGEFQPCKLR